MAGLNLNKLLKTQGSADQGRARTTQTSVVAGTVRHANRMMPSVDMDPLNPEDGIETAKTLFNAATQNILAIGELCLNMRERFPDFSNQIAPKMAEFLSRSRLYDVMAVAQAVRLGRLRPTEIPNSIRSGSLLVKLEDTTLEALRRSEYDFANTKPGRLRSAMSELGIEDRSLKDGGEKGAVAILPPTGKKDAFSELAAVLAKASKTGGADALSKRDVDHLHEIVQKNPSLKSFLSELISN